MSEESFSGKLKGGLQKVGAVMVNGYTVPMDKLIKYAAYLTIGFGFLAYLIHSALSSILDPAAWVTQIWLFILPIIGAVIYLVFVQKSLQSNFIDKKTHLFLIISTGIACAALFWPGIPLFILFIETSVGSKIPYWVALTEDQAAVPSKPKSATPSKPKPATTVTTPKPATTVTTPKPATTVTTPKPATTATTPKPATTATTPKPATTSTTQSSTPSKTQPSAPSTSQSSTPSKPSSSAPTRYQTTTRPRSQTRRRPRSESEE